MGCKVINELTAKMCCTNRRLLEAIRHEFTDVSVKLWCRSREDSLAEKIGSVCFVKLMVEGNL